MTHSIRIRLLVLYNLKNQLLTRDQIVKIFKVSLKSIYNWNRLYKPSTYEYEEIKQYMQQFHDNPKQKRIHKLTPEIELFIVDYVTKYNNRMINAKKIRKHLHKIFNICVCIDTIYKWFRKLNITYKKVNKKKVYVHKKQEK